MDSIVGLITTVRGTKSDTDVPSVPTITSRCSQKFPMQTHISTAGVRLGIIVIFWKGGLLGLLPQANALPVLLGSIVLQNLFSG